MCQKNAPYGKTKQELINNTNALTIVISIQSTGYAVSDIRWLVLYVVDNAAMPTPTQNNASKIFHLPSHSPNEMKMIMRTPKIGMSLL